jgi:hypothetical protein
MSASAIHWVESMPHQVTIEAGGIIAVRNTAPCDKIVLRNVSGQTVYSTVSASNQVFIPASKGFYVLTVGDAVTKVILP